MKKKFFTYLIALFVIIPCAFIFAACDNVELNNNPDLDGTDDVDRYTIAVSADVQNGTITTNYTSATEGENIILTVTPDDGYLLEEGSLKYNNNAVEYNSFLMPACNVVITANFVEMPTYYSVSIDVNDHAAGTINITGIEYQNGNMCATAGEEITFTPIPYYGYELVEGSVKVNNEPVQGNSFIMPAGNVVISAIFTEINYTITYHIDAQTTNPNTKSTLTLYEDFNPLKPVKDGYLFVDWYTEDTFVNSAEWVRCTGSNIDLYPKFEADPYTDGLVFEHKIANYNVSYYSVKSYSGTDTVIKLPKTYKNEVVKSISPDAFKNTNITSITIPDGLYEIGEHAFEGCTSLTSIDFGNSLIFVEIKDYTFQGCSSLTSITIPKFVTSIGEYAFDHCTNLTTVNFDTESDLKTISKDAFQYCTKLEAISIPYKVETIGDFAFAYDSKLEYVELLINEYGRVELEEIGSHAFYGCTELTSINLPNSLRFIKDYAFKSCEKLESIIIPSTVYRIGINPFVGCKNLKSISVYGNSYYRSFEGSNAIFTGDLTLISGCKNTVLPKDIPHMKIGREAFSNCDLEGDLVIPKNVEKIGEYAFNGCTRLNKVLIADSGIDEVGSFAFANCGDLTVYFTGSESYWDSIAKQNYLWQSSAEVVCYGLETSTSGYPKYEVNADIFDRDDIYEWPGLKDQYFVDEEVLYEGAMIKFFGNEYAITEDMAEFDTSTEGSGCIVVYVEDINMRFFFHHYDVVSVATCVKNAFEKQDYVYMIRCDGSHVVKNLELYVDGSLFVTPSIDYLEDPTNTALPKNTLWVVKEDDNYNRYKYARHNNNGYPVVSYNVGQPTVGYDFYSIKTGIITESDYDNGNFTINWGNGYEIIVIEGWLPKTITFYANGEVYEEWTYYYDNHYAIPEVPDLTWREEVNGVTVNNLPERFGSTGVVSVEGVSIVYGGVEYTDLTIICPPAMKYFEGGDDYLTYSIIVAFGSDRYCTEIKVNVNK